MPANTRNSQRRSPRSLRAKKPPPRRLRPLSGDSIAGLSRAKKAPLPRPRRKSPARQHDSPIALTESTCKIFSEWPFSAKKCIFMQKRQGVFFKSHSLSLARSWLSVEKHSFSQKIGLLAHFFDFFLTKETVRRAKTAYLCKTECINMQNGWLIVKISPTKTGGSRSLLPPAPPVLVQAPWVIAHSHLMPRWLIARL